MKISEYSLFKGVDNPSEHQYYYLGQTLVLQDENNYYDLLHSKRELTIFNNSNWQDQEYGILLEKDVDYYLDKINDCLKSMQKIIYDFVTTLISLTNHDHMHIKYLKKNLKKMISKPGNYGNTIMKLEALSYYFNKHLQSSTDQNTTKQYLEILQVIQQTLQKYNQVRDEYLQYKINADLLSDMNKKRKDSRLDHDKSLWLYAQNNHMDYEITSDNKKILSKTK